ncbi:MAG TPA: F0F1 ATP synthase subunit A, partial [Vicinamibacteria bacterium]|nr:F0F1 ATP synthase subunit A [Vicinamibacteria bacterium]
MMLSALLLTLALAQAPHQEPAAPATPAVETAATPAEAHPTEAAPTAGAESHAAATATEGGHAAPAEGGEHGGASAVLMHHVTDQADYRPFGLPIPFPSKHLFFLLVAMGLVILAARLAIASYKDGAPSGIGSVVETLVVFVRDEIAIKNIGHEGAKYTPLLLSFFFFILFAALF